MPVVFGEYASENVTALDPGMYDATINAVSLVMNGSEPAITQNGKKQVDVFFDVEGEQVKRRYSISFGQNTTNKQWSAFAKLIEVVTNIKCGDEGQRHVNDGQLINKRVRIVVETNDRGYSDVSNVMRSPQPQAQTKSRPQPVAAVNDAAGEESSGETDEIPF